MISNQARPIRLLRLHRKPNIRERLLLHRLLLLLPLLLLSLDNPAHREQLGHARVFVRLALQ